jgi:hypothetical protein
LRFGFTLTLVVGLPTLLMVRLPLHSAVILLLVLLLPVLSSFFLDLGARSTRALHQLIQSGVVCATSQQHREMKGKRQSLNELMRMTRMMMRMIVRRMMVEWSGLRRCAVDVGLTLAERATTGNEGRRRIVRESGGDGRVGRTDCVIDGGFLLLLTDDDQTRRGGSGGDRGDRWR